MYSPSRTLAEKIPMTFGRFPAFNSVPAEENVPTAMDIDEGDLSSLCDSISINAVRRSTLSNPAKDTGKMTPPITSINPNPVQAAIVKQQSSKKGILSPMFRLIGDIDENTMRKIAMLPYMMSGYIQLLFNITLPTFFLYWMYSFACTIQSDVDKKVMLFSEEVMEQIAKCSRDYRENRCDPSTRVPALVSACQAWEECMGRDPHLVARRSGISAEIFGETLNSFFNALSWKTILSLIVIVLGVSVVFNLTFSMSRKAHREETTVHVPQLKQVQNQAGSARRRRY